MGEYTWSTSSRNPVTFLVLNVFSEDLFARLYHSLFKFSLYLEPKHIYYQFSYEFDRTGPAIYTKERGCGLYLLLFCFNQAILHPHGFPFCYLDIMLQAIDLIIC